MATKDYFKEHGETLDRRMQGISSQIGKLEAKVNNVAKVNDNRHTRTFCELKDLQAQIDLLASAIDQKNPGPTVTVTFDRDELLKGFTGLNHAIRSTGACPARDNAQVIMRQLRKALKV
jgi:hypothetical protein